MADTVRSLLVCPLTKQQLLPLDSKRARMVEAALNRGELRYVDGTTLKPGGHRLEFLISENAHHLYSVIDGVACLFEDRQIDLHSLQEE